MAGRLRFLHKVLAPVSGFLLLLNVLTGAAYAFLKYGLGSKKEDIKWLMNLHQGNLLPMFPNFKILYCILLGLFILFFAATGFSMLRMKVKIFPSTTSQLHHLMALVTIVMITLTAASGMLYRLLSIPEKTATITTMKKWLLYVHIMNFDSTVEMSYISVYTFFTALLCFSGYKLWFAWFKKQWKNSSNAADKNVEKGTITPLLKRRQERALSSV